MSNIPIFDCVTHPSLDGSWLHPRWSGQNSFARLGEQMSAANVPWCLAIGMGDSSGYDLQQYSRECIAQDHRLFPIAFLHLERMQDARQLADQLDAIRRLGYCGIKIHPRVSEIDFEHPLLPDAIRLANRRGLAVLLCTYFYSSNPKCRRCNPELLRDLLLQVPDEKLLLLHAGGVRVLEISELTRPFKKVLLDVSFTLCEYAGSSIDLDLRWVFERCHHRVCIGSDSPEVPLIRLRERFEQLTFGLPDSIREQIAYRNLFAFMGLSP